MSIPFCIALTILAAATPTMQTMTTYDDPEVNALVERVTLLSDENVPTLCCRIEVDLADGGKIDRYEEKTPTDFSFDRATVSELVRRIGAETGVPSSAYDRLERFVDQLPKGDVGAVIQSFGEAPRMQHAA